ncbi:Trp operon leader peptide [Vibrio sp. CAU 1672]|nr:Trp operon leader peptide [Vibrio sp. CAU 1672]MDF2154272.1 Trp operon leader peptide [Vibrio sp. CAU 1672]
MLQEFNYQQKAKIAIHLNQAHSADLSWWRTWKTSGWAPVHF